MSRSVVTLIKRDDRVRRLARSFDSLPYFQLPFNDLQEEVEQIHEMRRVRNLKLKTSNFVDDIIQANVQDQSNRSRLVEIMMKSRTSQRKLEQALDPLVEHILIEYAAQLKTVRTKEERKQYINTALAKFYKHIYKAEALYEQAELVVLDIDKAGYSLKLTVEALKISSQKETYV
jgi:anaerobic ribonucleoside-triphosphate reductase